MLTGVWRSLLKPPPAAIALCPGLRPGRERNGFPAPGSPTASARGFTLLELIVVLLLMALVTTLAMPNLERLSAGMTRKTERDRILDQFVGLGRRAMLQGRSYVVLGARRRAGRRPLRDGAGNGECRTGGRARWHGRAFVRLRHPTRVMNVT